MIVVRAPANIALIKYMGKSDAAKNLPANPSLSLTLDEFSTWVEFRESHEAPSEFDELSTPIVLSESELKKRENHFERLRLAAPDLFRRFKLTPLRPWNTPFEVRSANTFPTACGVASSASSFAAYTFGFFVFFGGRAFTNLWNTNAPELKAELAKLSQQGSGSSCRSLLGPWVSWSEDTVQTQKSSFSPLVDMLLVVSKEPKKVSSSEAHQRVLTSPLWNQRQENVLKRYAVATAALKNGDYNALKKAAWDDFLEMHELFHTSKDSFSYWTDETKAVLNFFKEIELTDRPIITMDAGPNIHLLVPTDETLFWEIKIKEAFPHLEILTDQQGKGPSVIFDNSVGFKTTVPGKWVLAGEHTVLRGGSAVALPHPEYKLSLEFSPQKINTLQVEPQSVEVTVLSLLERAQEVLKSKNILFDLPKGILKIESSIPTGAGLGSSAALCVALSRFVLAGLLPNSQTPDEIDLARELEHVFHGKSSGMDVAVVSLEKPILFSMESGAKPLKISKFPSFLFVDTGLRSSTRDCVLKVEEKRKSNVGLATQWDEQMNLASSEVVQGLESNDLHLLAQGMNRSQKVFESWGLVPSKVTEISKENTLKDKLAWRLTGAGDGGFLVALS